ncbi:hypothetical protein CFOL_v3_34010 [Cephalotus follicularis]|uniref:Protein JASON n=1 Tax=Cephalotus follicularis TaxID=3775 RepID=A0A1Q3DDT2_CEPFO|nr:hypothetical protein CFOL_v3_34010 [Cephalotus follicularis]
MICRLLSREVEIFCRSVVRFVDTSVSRAMGCFFGCFRIRDDHRSRTNRFNQEAVTSKNRLSSLFVSQDNAENTKFKDRDHVCLDLKDEAKFLKACGTIPETPTEIRKASQKLKGSPPCDTDSEPLKFHSWLPGTSIKKLQFDKQPDLLPTPMEQCEEMGKGSLSSEQTPTSCISKVQNTGSVSIGSIEGSETGSVVTSDKFPATDDIIASKIQYKNKSVRFDGNFDISSTKGSSSGSASQTSKKFESPENLANGKTRIRSQYVYSVLNPVENECQWKVIKKEDSNSYQMSGELKEFLDQSEHTAAMSEVGMKETSAGKDLKVEASLSSWLKSSTSIADDGNQNFLDNSRKNHHFVKTPGERPIIGMVAAHWNEDEFSHISPKWWDGNGIPNSTNKYKEDQKVSWHATPFEERLEKALSDENLISQRKHVDGKPILFGEGEESDTALSKFNPSMHAKSVVSF